MIEYLKHMLKILRQYPKIIVLLFSMILAYAIFAMGWLHWLGEVHGIGGIGGAMIGGMLFSFGFTTAFGIGVFVEIADNIHPIIGALAGGTGALLSDLLIFNVMQFECFHEEIHRLKSAKLVIWLRSVIHHESWPERLRKYLLWSFAGIIIASPLPDEFGVSMVSSLTSINKRTFGIISFGCNTIGVFLILVGARTL